MSKSMALYFQPDGNADVYDPDLDTVIHFHNKAEQEEFEEWLKEEAGEMFARWRDSR